MRSLLAIVVLVVLAIPSTAPAQSNDFFSRVQRLEESSASNTAAIQQVQVELKLLRAEITALRSECKAGVPAGVTPSLLPKTTLHNGVTWSWDGPGNRWLPVETDPAFIWHPLGDGKWSRSRRVPVPAMQVSQTIPMAQATVSATYRPAMMYRQQASFSGGFARGGMGGMRSGGACGPSG